VGILGTAAGVADGPTAGLTAAVVGAAGRGRAGREEAGRGIAGREEAGRGIAGREEAGRGPVGAEGRVPFYGPATETGTVDVPASPARPKFLFLLFRSV